KVTAETSFNVTGRPAQFGRGVMAEVGGKLIDRFAENLAELLRGDATTAERPGAEPAAEAAPAAAEPAQAEPAAEAEPEAGKEAEKEAGRTAGERAERRPAGVTRTSRTAE